MSDSDANDIPAHGEPPDAADQGDGHDHDDHGPAEGTLGPVDSAAWGAGILGVALGLVVALCFVLATGPTA
jgi:hypothetical protein